MKLTAFILLVALIQISAKSPAQTVTISRNNISLGKVFRDIHKQTGYNFLCTQEQLSSSQKVSLNLKNAPLREVLDFAFRDQPLTYSILNKTIIVKHKKMMMDQQESAPLPPPIHITGTITDSATGDPLVGVTIQVKGNTIGTTTDVNGHFSLEVEEDAVLVISYLGYNTKEIDLNGKTTVNIVLEASATGLNQLVVVGYGTQKKINLTGAVEVVDNKELTNRAVGNLSQALQGATPGLNIFSNNSGGEPDATMDFNIRGLGSPYVLVDGLPMDINLVNPANIENISVIKDASAAAIYGANAPYGVILITTKQGGSADGKPRLSYDNTLTMGTPTLLPHPPNSYDFATIINAATINAGNSPYFSATVLQRIKQYMNDPHSIPAVGPDPIDSTKWAKRENANGNTNWYDVLLKPWSFRQKHDLSINGGKGNLKYYVSLGYFDHQGQMHYGNENYKRYNIDANISSQITKWMRLNLLTKFSRSASDYPNDGYGLDRNVMWHDFPRRFPTDPVKYPNDTWSEMSRIEIFQNGGREKQTTNDFWTKLEAEIQPLEGWTINVNYGWNNFNAIYSNHRAMVYATGPTGERYVAFDTQPVNLFTETFSNNVYWNANIYTSYEHTIKNNYFKVLIGHQREYKSYKDIDGSKTNLVTDNVPSLSTATGSETLDDNLSDWATMGTFARINYSFKDRYLLELNGRYQGSSRFEQKTRFGFFPSVSLGYRISNEEFWNQLRSYINSFKFRSSYGSLGNQNVANYLYLPVMPIISQVSWINGNGPVPGVSAPGLVSSNLTWETVRTFDVGFDASLFAYRLDVSFDYFQRDIVNMVGQSDALPAILGVAAPSENNASEKNNGWEVSIGWNNKIGSDFNYNIRFGISDYKTVITKWNNPSKLLSQNYPGKTLGEIWGYGSGGLFQSEEEITKSADQSWFFPNWNPGDVKYTDRNKDGKITPGNNTLDDHGDLSIIGNSNPRYIYNIHLGATYKHFDLSVLFNGVGKQDVWFNNGDAYFWGTTNDVWQTSVFQGHLDYYRKDNEGAYWPRPYMSSETYKNRQVSTRYLQSAAYLRLKSLQIGYTLPGTLTQRVSISKMRIFFSTENLLTISNMIGFIDPEAIFGEWGQGKVYPLQKTLSLGINVNF